MDGLPGCRWRRPLVARARTHDMNGQTEKCRDSAWATALDTGGWTPGKLENLQPRNRDALAAPSLERRGTAASTASCVVEGAAHEAAGHPNWFRSFRTLEHDLAGGTCSRTPVSRRPTQHCSPGRRQSPSARVLPFCLPRPRPRLRVDRHSESTTRQELTDIAMGCEA
jgi:hypothetical protein